MAAQMKLRWSFPTLSRDCFARRYHVHLISGGDCHSPRFGGGRCVLHTWRALKWALHAQRVHCLPTGLPICSRHRGGGNWHPQIVWGWATFGLAMPLHHKRQGPQCALKRKRLEISAIFSINARAQTLVISPFASLCFCMVKR